MASVQEAYFELISAVRNDEIPFVSTNRHPLSNREISLEVRYPKQVGTETIVFDGYWIDDLDVDDLDSEFECRLVTYLEGGRLTSTNLGSEEFGSPQSVIDGLSCFLCGFNSGRRAGIAAAQVSISKHMDRMEA